MANPKYADLPGIARDQPDIYETTDLPEADQSTSSVDQSESVQQLNISANDAYEKFKDKRVDANSVDFSDTIGQKKSSGYDIRSGNWEMLGDSSEEKETPQQRYYRLQHEMRELVEDLNQMKVTIQKETKDQELSPATLAKLVENLQHELVDINMEKMLGTAAIASLSDPHNALQKKLLTQLEGFKEQAVTSKPKEKQPSSSGGGDITYELHIKPEIAKLDMISKISDLEQRLKNLENIVGKDQQKLSPLALQTNDKSIVNAIHILSARTSLLDPTHLDQVEGRLVALQQRLLLISEKKTQVEDIEKQNKISELYDLLKKTEMLNVNMPVIMDRLLALKELHEQALQFSKALTQLDTVQQQITSSLKKDEKLLLTVQDVFTKNTEMFKNNMASLDARIAALKK
ncbi:dynactin subunit 2-A [Centruroides vittatus]|uniref:dynactin subunit 2-A n=1 Tax=Centruroides vittatus TaxID=120091 RepID=UPI00350F176B